MTWVRGGLRLSAASIFVINLAPGCLSPGPCDGPSAFGACFEREVLQVHLGAAPDDVSLADMDDDGLLDLIASSREGGSVTIVWGVPGRLGAQATTWSMGSRIEGLATADFDGDGRRDVAVALPLSGEVAVRSGEEHRSLGAVRTFSVGSGRLEIAAAELDGAPPAELVAVDQGGTITVWHGFTLGASLSVGSEVRDLAVVDWDANGKQDIALALPARHAVQVLSGDGGGGLSPGPLYPVGGAPLAVVSGDLDMDGASDLATANALDDSVSVLLGDGEGDIREERTLETGPEPRGLYLVREGADTRALYVVTHAASAVERIDFQGGAPLRGATSSGLTALAAADLDGDSRDELFYGDSSLNEIGSLRSDVGLSLATRWQSSGVDVAIPLDIDGDGIQEIVVAPSAPPLGGAADGLQILDGAGKLVFELPLDANVERPLDARAVDANADGLLDIVAWGYSSLRVFEQRGDGSFGDGKTFSAQGSISGVEIADVDSDGTLDALVAVGSGNQTGKIVGVDLSSAGELSPAFERVVDDVPRSLIPTNLDGNGSLDLIYLEGTTPVLIHDVSREGERRVLDETGLGAVSSMVLGLHENRAELLLCGAAGLMRIPDVTTWEAGLPQRIGRTPCEGISLVHLNDDGLLDILVQHLVSVENTQRMFLTPWIRSGNAFTSSASQGLVVDNFQSVRVAQLDSDVGPELLVSHDHTLQVLAAGLGQALESTPVFAFAEAFTWVDLNHDGYVDLLGTGRALGVALGDGAGDFGPFQQRAVAEVLPGADTVTSAVIGDFDQDGREDVIVTSLPRAEWRTDLFGLELASSGELLATPRGTVPAGELVVLPADLNGDRAPDLLGLWGREQLRTTLITRSQSGELTASPGVQVSGAKLTPGLQLVDLDRNGLLDIVASSTAQGVLVYAGAGEGRFSPGRVWSHLRSVKSANFVDLDGDGHVDLLGSVSNRLIRARGPGPVHSVQTLLAGANVAAAIDINGDGRPELLAAGPSLEAEGSTTLHVGADLGPGFRFVRVEVPTPAPTRIEVRDMNEDGAPEIVLQDAGHAAILQIQHVLKH